jgi:hypothetical protein
MADEQRRPILEIEDSPRRRHVVGERGLGLLHDRHVEPLLAQDLVHALPS